MRQLPNVTRFNGVRYVYTNPPKIRRSEIILTVIAALATADGHCSRD